MNDSSNYIDMNEAARLTDRSYSTMRNLVRNMSIDEKERYLIKDGKRILLSREFVASKYRILEDEKEDKSDIEKSVLDTIEVLKGELQNKQKTIDELIERLKESNYNQGSLHKFLNDLGLSESDIQNRLK